MVFGRLILPEDLSCYLSAVPCRDSPAALLAHTANSKFCSTTMAVIYPAAFIAKIIDRIFWGSAFRTIWRILNSAASGNCSQLFFVQYDLIFVIHCDWLLSFIRVLNQWSVKDRNYRSDRDHSDTYFGADFQASAVCKLI